MQCVDASADSSGGATLCDVPLLGVYSLREKRKYVLLYRSFSDTLPSQREYTLISKVSCRAVGHLSVGTKFVCVLRGKTRTARQRLLCDT